MDRSTRPGDDFSKYANGKWDQETAIPPDRAAWGIGAILDEQARERTRMLLDGARSQSTAGSDQRKAADYYAAYMNEAAVEARGLATLQPMLDRMAAIADRGALARELGSMLRADVDPLNATEFHTDRLFGLWAAQDLNEPSRNTAYLLQGGLAMPDREYYLADNPKMAETRTRYRAHVVKVLGLAGIADADRKAQRIVDLETRIASVHARREDSADVHTAQAWTREDFDRKAPGLDWAGYFGAAGLERQRAFVVWHPAATTGEAALVGSQPIATWKDYLAYITIDHWSRLLPRAFAEERFDFFGRTLAGTPQMPERWKRAVDSTNAAVGDVVGKLYVAKYFSAAAKARAQAMVADIKTAFARRIDALDWMSPQTKARATEKVQSLIVGVGLVFATGWLRLDPIVALAVAVHIIWTGIGLVRRSVAGLLDAAISRDDQGEVTKIFNEYSRRYGVTFHAFRTRQAGARRFISFHLLVPDEWTVQRAHQLSEEIEERIRSLVPNSGVSVHIEPISDPASYDDEGLDRM